MNKIQISVIIPLYKDWEGLAKCLRGLSEQNIDVNIFETLVVCNEETVNIPSTFSLPDTVQLLHEPQPGSYAARNLGAKEAKGDILAFIDSDCVPSENWLKESVKMIQDQGCNVVCGRVDFSYQKQDQLTMAEKYDRMFGFPFKNNLTDGQEMKSLGAGNLICRKQIFEHCGGFDTHVKSGGDWMFAHRIMSKGYRIIYGDSVLVWHPARTRIKGLVKQHRRILGGFVDNQKGSGHPRPVWEGLRRRLRGYRFQLQKCRMSTENKLTKVQVAFVLLCICAGCMYEAGLIYITGKTKRS